MKILVTNDDGIDAGGLWALAEAAGAFGTPVVVAPDRVLSGCSHQLTWERPFEVRDHPRGGYVVSGTPVDCVRVGLSVIAPDASLVLSGINAGENLSLHNSLASGTIAAVREGVLHGVPGVALSHDCIDKSAIDWGPPVGWARSVLGTLLPRPAGDGAFWSVNFPMLGPGAGDPDLAFCALDPTPLPIPFDRDGVRHRWAGDYRTRPRAAGMDVDLCFSGKTTVTRLSIGLS